MTREQELQMKLDDAVETINRMQTLILPYTRGITGERILAAYNLGASFNHRNPEEFNRFLIHRGKNNGEAGS